MATDSSVDSSTNKNGATGRKEIRVWMDGWYFIEDVNYVLKPEK